MSKSDLCDRLIELNSSHYDRMARIRTFKNHLLQLQSLSTKTNRTVSQLEYQLVILKSELKHLQSFKTLWTTPEFVDDFSIVSSIETFLNINKGIENYSNNEHSFVENTSKTDKPINSNFPCIENSNSDITPSCESKTSALVFESSTEQSSNIKMDTIESKLYSSSASNSIGNENALTFSSVFNTEYYENIKSHLQFLLETKINFLSEISELEKKKSLLLETSLRDRQEWLTYKQSLGQICKLIGSFTSSIADIQNTSTKKASSRKGDTSK